MTKSRVNRLKDLLTHKEYTIVEADEIIELAREYFKEPEPDTGWDDCRQPSFTRMGS